MVLLGRCVSVRRISVVTCSVRMLLAAGQIGASVDLSGVLGLIGW